MGGGVEAGAVETLFAQQMRSTIRSRSWLFISCDESSSEKAQSTILYSRYSVILGDIHVSKVKLKEEVDLAR